MDFLQVIGALSAGVLNTLGITLASMAVGMVSFVAIQQVTKRVLDMHVIVPSLALAAAAFVAVSLVTAPPKERVLHLFWGDRPLP